MVRILQPFTQLYSGLIFQLQNGQMNRANTKIDLVLNYNIQSYDHRLLASLNV